MGYADLRFVESSLVNFLVQCLGNDGALEHTILAEEQPVFERKLSEREANDETLPWEKGPVKPAGQTLEQVSLMFVIVEKELKPCVPEETPESWWPEVGVRGGATRVEFNTVSLSASFKRTRQGSAGH